MRIIRLTEGQWDIIASMVAKRLGDARDYWKPAEQEAEELYRAVMAYETEETV